MGVSSQTARKGAGGRPAWWDSKQHQASNPPSPPPVMPLPASLAIYSTSPVRKKSAEIVFSRYWASALASLPELSAVAVHICVMIHQPSERIKSSCSGPWFVLALAGIWRLVVQIKALPPPLRAGGLDCAFPSTSLREATICTRALSLLEAYSTGGIREC